jgi:hypothetical protein
MWSAVSGGVTSSPKHANLLRSPVKILEFSIKPHVGTQDPHDLLT